MDFRDVNGFLQTVHKQLGHEGDPYLTAARWLSREREAFQRGGADRQSAACTRRDIAHMVLEIKAARRESKAADDEPQAQLKERRCATRLSTSGSKALQTVRLDGHVTGGAAAAARGAR